MASPGENVSLVVMTGTILSPVDGCDHLEFLCIELVARESELTAADSLNDRFHLFSMRAAYDEHLLYASKSKAL